MSHGTNVELALRDLAIEIEKLQAERNGWKTIAHCSHCEPQHDYFCTKHRVEDDGQIDAWSVQVCNDPEAVRGD